MRVDFGTPELTVFLLGAQAKIDAHYAKEFPAQKPTVLSLMQGPKFIRVVATVGGTTDQNSAWAFICRETGAVLKAESWKRPAKGARGNIFNTDNGLSRVSAYGPAYLR